MITLDLTTADRELDMQAVGKEPWSSVGSSISTKWASLCKDVTKPRWWWRWDMGCASQQHTTELDFRGYIWFRNTSVVVVVIATCFSYFWGSFYQSIESTTHSISLNILFCSKRNHIQNYFSCMTNSNSWIRNMKNWLWFIIYWTISLCGKTTKTYSKELLHQWLECQRNRKRYLVNQNKRSSLDFR